MQEKLQSLYRNALKVGLWSNTRKTKIMRINTNNTNLLELNFVTWDVQFQEIVVRMKMLQSNR